MPNHQVEIQVLDQVKLHLSQHRDIVGKGSEGRVICWTSKDGLGVMSLSSRSRDKSGEDEQTREDRSGRFENALDV